MPVFSTLKTSKRKTRNRQRYLYGYTTDSNAMSYLEGSGSLETSETPADVLISAIDFSTNSGTSEDADIATTTGASYNSAPLVTNISMNGSMGNTLNFDFSVLVEILEEYSVTPTTTVTEPGAGTIYDYGTTRYYCQGDNEPVEFNWNVSTNVTNSGCVDSVAETCKVKVDSFNASFTQYFEDAFPTGDNTYSDATDSGATVTVDYCTNALFLPPNVGVGTGGDDSNALIGLWDFSVSESGTEYTPDNSTGRKFITAECDGIPEIPTDWLDFPAVASV